MRIMWVCALLKYLLICRCDSKLRMPYVIRGLHSHRNSTRQEWECEGYIRLVCHILNLFLSHLKAIENMSINQYSVKGCENVSNVSPRYRRYFDYILVQVLSIDCGLKFHEKCERMKLSTVSWFSRVAPDSLFSHKCKCLHLCVLRLIYNYSKVSTSTLNENVNQA